MDDDPLNCQAEDDDRRYQNDPKIHEAAMHMIQLVQQGILSPEDLDCASRVARRIIDRRMRLNHRGEPWTR